MTRHLTLVPAPDPVDAGGGVATVGRAATWSGILAATLRDLRKGTGATNREFIHRLAADGVKHSQSWISKVERGLLLPDPPSMEAWARACRATVEEQAALRALLSRLADRPQLVAHRGGTRHQRNYLMVTEAQARSITEVAVSVVPALLCSDRYAVAAAEVRDEHETAALLADVERRRALLTDGRCRVTAVLLESALRYRPAGLDVQREQVAHLLTLAELDHVVIRIVRDDQRAGLTVPAGFRLVDDRQVMTEMLTTYVVLSDPEDVAPHRTRANSLLRRALDAGETMPYLSGLLDELTREADSQA